jgi:predicted TIM-barrel fold metal-dependent hydrolase
MTERIVDAWMQHPNRGMWAHPMFEPLRQWTGRSLPEELPVAATIASLDAGPVAHAMVSAWHGPQGAIVSNDEVAAIVGAAPDRFTGIASVDLARPMSAVRELRRCVRDLGFRGLRVLPWLWRLPPNDRHYYPLYAECIELGVPFCLQVGHTGPLAPSEPGRPIPYLDEVALDFSELVSVGGHIGWPWTLEMISLCRKYPNVYIDTSAYKPSRYPPELVEYMRAGGCKKVLFGTNYPMLMPRDCIAELDALQLDPDARRRFLADNAVDVFGLDGRS